MGETYSYHVIKGLCNSVILVCDKTRKCVIIDPSVFDKIIQKVDELHLTVDKILLTHGHYDHIFYAEKMRDIYSAKIYCHKLEEKYLLDIDKNYSRKSIGKDITLKADIFFGDGDIINLGNLKINVIHTPGHTKGSVSYFINDEKKPILFSGDTIFKGTIGRTDLYGGSFGEIVNSIQEKLIVLPENSIVIPGHGSFTTLNDEKDTISLIKENKLFG